MIGGGDVRAIAPSRSALVTQCPDEHPPDFRLLEDCRVQPFTLPLAFPDPRWCDQPVMCKVKAALPLTHLKSIFSAVCVQRPVWGISELITCKLLDEPIPGGIADEVCIAHLRYVAQQLGPEWHYVPPRDAIFIRDGDSSDDSDLAETEHDCEVRFCILAPGCCPEFVTVRLRIPCTVDEALGAVQAERQPSFVRRFPNLLTVQPHIQGRTCIMVAYADSLEECAGSRRLVCVDTSAFHHRLLRG